MDHLELLYQTSCVDAARDMVAHIHQIFTIAPSLRQWSYYCFYCLQATLVLLTRLIDDDGQSTFPCIQGTEVGDSDGSEDQHNLQYYCQLSIDIFELLKLKAAERCAQVVQSFLGRWEKSRGRQKHHHGHQQSQPATAGSSKRSATRQGLGNTLQQTGSPEQTVITRTQDP